jgi:hypothetical protein
LIVIDRKTNCRIANTIAGLNKRSELDIKDYEIAILTAVVINVDPVDSAGTDFKIDAVRILIIFVFIRNVDICQISKFIYV